MTFPRHLDRLPALGEIVWSITPASFAASNRLPCPPRRVRVTSVSPSVVYVLGLDANGQPVSVNDQAATEYSLYPNEAEARIAYVRDMEQALEDLDRERKAIESALEKAEEWSAVVA